MYLPCRGSHLTIWDEASKQALVISATELDSWKAAKCQRGLVGVALRSSTNRFVLTLLSTDDRCVRSEGEMDSGEAIVDFTENEHAEPQLIREINLRDQVGLELVQIDVQRSVESQRSGDGGDNLSDQPVQVGVSRRLDSEVLSADVVDAIWFRNVTIGSIHLFVTEEAHRNYTHASLSTMKEQSECSKVVWVVKTEL